MYVAPLDSPSYAKFAKSLKETTQYFSSSQSKYHQTAKSLTAINKSEVYRVRMTVGGNHLDAYQDVRSPVVSTLDAKLHINSKISDAQLRFWIVQPHI